MVDERRSGRMAPALAASLLLLLVLPTVSNPDKVKHKHPEVIHEEENSIVFMTDIKTWLRVSNVKGKTVGVFSKERRLVEYIDEAEGGVVSFTVSDGKHSVTVEHLADQTMLFAVIARGPHGLEAEILGTPEQITLMFLLEERCVSHQHPEAHQRHIDEPCVREHGKTPVLGLQIEFDVVYVMLKRHEKLKDGPKTVEHRPDMSDENILVVLSMLPFDVEIAWLPDENHTGARKGFLPAVPEGEPASYQLFAPTTEHVFAARATESVHFSREFRYLGGMYIVAIGENDSHEVGVSEHKIHEYELIREFSDTYRMKPMFDAVGTKCAAEMDAPRGPGKWEAEVATRWIECLETTTIFPMTGTRLPPELVKLMFMRTWETVERWRLCEWQTPSVPLRSYELVDENGETLTVEVYREKPLVVNVKEFIHEHVCDSLHISSSWASAVVDDHRYEKVVRRASEPHATFPMRIDLARQNNESAFMHRLFDNVQKISGHDFQVHGQEPLHVMRFKDGHELKSQCDGECMGTAPAHVGQRVATAVLHCTAADRGGAMAFPVDSIKIPSTEKELVLHIYDWDPEGVSEYTICPVLEGEETTVHQMFREGVNETHSWAKHRHLEHKRRRDEL